MTSTVLVTDVRNRNGRTYPRTVVADALVHAADRLRRGRLFVYATEREDDEPSLADAVATVTRLTLVLDRLVAEYDLLDTPRAAQVRRQIEAGELVPITFGYAKFTRGVVEGFKLRGLRFVPKATSAWREML